MTNKQFFNILRRNRKNWYIDFDTEVRNDENVDLFCPLTYVCYKKTGEYFDLEEFNKAAAKLSIGKLRAEALAGAADNFCKTSSRKRLRRELLKALALKEDE